MAQNRYATFPSRMQLQIFKNRCHGAKRGHSLLKRKSDALKAHLRKVVREIYDVKLQMNDVMKTAQFSHTQARRAAGDFNGKVISKVERAATKTTCVRGNIVGVKVVTFEKRRTGVSDDSLMGITRGGAQIRKCGAAFGVALDLLIRLASLQAAFRDLDSAMKVTNRRVNALDNVIIPKLENTMMYIASELDEREREDLFRLKKIVTKKKKEQAIADAIRRKKEEEEYEAAKTAPKSKRKKKAVAASDRPTIFDAITGDEPTAAEDDLSDMF